MSNDKWFEMNQSTQKLIGEPPKRKIPWGSILAVVPTLLLVVLFIQNIVFFLLNRPQDIVKEMGALVATLPNSIPDRNCTDLACHWAALQTALAQLNASHAAISSDLEKSQTAFARLKAGQEAGQTALAELKAGHNASQSLLAKVWQEISSDKGLLSQTLKDLKTDYKSMSQELSQENKNFSWALSSLQQKVVDQPTLNRELRALMARDCSQVMAAGKSQSGVYTIFSGSNSFEAYCNMRQDGGGWTVIQRRKDGSVNFFRDWNDYQTGFGDLAGEHWLGLQNIHALTASGGYQLRIDITDYDGRTYYALYDDFSVGRNSLDPEKDGYPLLVSGYSGNTGDQFTYHSGMKFTTKDRDQDKRSAEADNNCANMHKGGWWYNNCHGVNLNGPYKDHSGTSDDGVTEGASGHSLPLDPFAPRWGKLTDGTPAAMGIINRDNIRMAFVTTLWTDNRHVGPLEGKQLNKKKMTMMMTTLDMIGRQSHTSTMNRLVSPRASGRSHVESGDVRSGNHRVPPVAKEAWSTEMKTVLQHVRNS
ncbi:fibrinogen C domain-containing protein 1-like [Syngnathus acus]|uniref:fibrinogen C domain-containing protein 1-like n=1 Tax=Syngnathus acus TaxID=161584 RepID=UPI0018863E87|nr:fibrinogen C domain-containing protein 1-like [Syngnathus acus]